VISIVSGPFTDSCRKHVFHDLEPYMCTFEDCPIADKTYSTSRAFITHEMRHHRDVSRVFACDHCGGKFNRKRDARKHLHFDQCGGDLPRSRRISGSGGKTKSGFSVVEERVADSVCPFCTKLITGGRGYLTQHLGRHLEEISFAIVRKPYEEWQFYEDSVSATSPAPSIVLNRNIHQAAAEGNVRLGIDLLRAGADVDAEIDGKTPLYIASAAGHYALVWLLLQKGADHQKKSVEGDHFVLKGTPLEAASKAGHVEVAALLAKISFDQGLLSTNKSALQLAAEAGNSETVKELVRIFGTVGEDCHPTPLYFAAKHGHIDIVKFLLLNGAKGTPTERKTNLRGFSAVSYDKEKIADPLLASLEGARRDIALLLLDSGACISQSAWRKAASGDDLELVCAMLANRTKPDFDSESALTGVVQAGNAEIIAKLMENGVVASPKAVTQACCLGHLSVLEILLQQGACPKMSDLEGAVRNGHADIVKALALRCPKLQEDLIEQVKSSAQIVRENIMTKALESGSLNTVKLLLGYGGVLPRTSPPTGRDNYYGQDNALHHAAKSGHCDIVRLLLAKGFDPNVEGYYRENPLHRACDSGHEEVVRLLLEAGANVKGTNGARLRSPIGYASDKGRTNIIHILRLQDKDL
jgi:ankyrin repeat protein